jgi:hypothetical protein
MVSPKKARGRASASSSGTAPNEIRWAIVPAIACGIGGQPGMLISGLPETSCETGTAPVGFGSAAGRPPKAAQLPTAITAAACSTVSASRSMLVRPAIIEYTPPAAVGTEPSTTTTYLPALSFIDCRREASAASPETDCSAWW